MKTPLVAKFGNVDGLERDELLDMGGGTTNHSPRSQRGERADHETPHKIQGRRTADGAA